MEENTFLFGVPASTSLDVIDTDREVNKGGNGGKLSSRDATNDEFINMEEKVPLPPQVVVTKKTPIKVSEN